MQNTITLAAIREEALADPAHVFHSSLPLYILVEKRSGPDNPDWIDIACLNRDGAEGMMVYLSPLDALLDSKARNRKGGEFFIHPFEAIDPRPYIASHDHWLTLYLVYGFAARAEKLVLSDSGELQAMTLVTHFRITPDQFDHFQLAFPDELIDSLNAMHVTAGLHDYGGILEDQADVSLEELDRDAQEATRRIGPFVTGGSDDITGCAVYDPIEQRWRFAVFTDIPD